MDDVMKLDDAEARWIVRPSSRWRTRIVAVKFTP